MRSLVLILALVAGNAFAAGPFDVRGVALGDTQEQLQSLHPNADCKAGDGVFSEVSCFIRGYGNVEDAVVLYYLVGGKVESVNVALDADQFSGIVLAMKAKFGDPKMTETTVSNAMGAEFRNRTATWLTMNERVVAEERAGKVDKSIVTLRSMDGMRASMERFKASKAAEASAL